MKCLALGLLLTTGAAQAQIPPLPPLPQMPVMGGAPTMPIMGGGVTGGLINTRTTTSITGQMMWVCTYRVGGTVQQVNLPYMCPASMQFH